MPVNLYPLSLSKHDTVLRVQDTLITRPENGRQKSLIQISVLESVYGAPRSVRWWRTSRKGRGVEWGDEKQDTGGGILRAIWYL